MLRSSSREKRLIERNVPLCCGITLLYRIIVDGFVVDEVVGKDKQVLGQVDFFSLGINLLAYAEEAIAGLSIIVSLIFEAWFGLLGVIVWRVKYFAGDENILVDLGS
jgi:hypothetical protein